MQNPRDEIELYISVDVETAGPNPSQFALLSIGACTVDERRRTFYVELKPGSSQSTPEAQAIHNLDLEALRDLGLPPEKAMAACERGVQELTPAGMTFRNRGSNRDNPDFGAVKRILSYLSASAFGHTALD